MQINQETKLVAVVGYPLEHTLSPLIHTAALRNRNINMVFLALPVKEIKDAIHAMRAFNIKAYAVTMPHKQKVMKYLDKINPEALKLGNVNTVVNKGGQLIGYNTDIDGAKEALKDVDVKGKAVFIIGAGGVARTCAYVVRKKGGKLFIVNRDKKEALRITKDFKAHYLGGIDVLSKEPKIWPSLIINATPLGMGKLKDEQPVCSCYFRTKPAVFDVVYNPLETKLIKEAGRSGSKIITGSSMFIHQAAKQFELYAGEKAPLTVIKNAFRKNII